MLNERNSDVKPEWRYVKIDETHYWDEESNARKLGKRLIATYAYNKNSQTFCCSLTPSYWLLYLGTEAQYEADLTDEQRELIENDIQESEREEQCGYYTCSFIDNMESKPLPYNIDVDREDFGLS